MHRQELESLSREELIGRAEAAGIGRPRVLTQDELVDELIAHAVRDLRGNDREKSRGWFGKARDLLAGVVERGLHLPDVAKALRTQSIDGEPWPEPPAPLATMTLAEIYAKQGHHTRALEVVDEILERDPAHLEALRLRDRLASRSGRADKGRSHHDEQLEGPAVHAAASDASNAGNAGAPAGGGGASGADGGGGRGKKPSTKRAHDDEGTEVETDAKAADAKATNATDAQKAITAPTEGVEAAKPEAGATSAMTSEGAPALPDRYGVDEVVALATDPRTLYVYWEVQASTLADARVEAPSGALVLRLLSTLPSWQGPVVKSRDVRVDALYGDAFVSDVEPGSNVRVSVGWATGDDYVPLAVGLELMVPREASFEVVDSNGGASASANANGAPAVHLDEAHVPEPRPEPRGEFDGALWSRSADQGGAQPAQAAQATDGAANADARAHDDDGAADGVEHDLGTSHFERHTSSQYDEEEEFDLGPGGASERLRARIRRMRGASETVRGGASETARGGASERLRAAANRAGGTPGTPPIRIRA